MIAAKLVGSVIGKKIDNKYFGGAFGRNKERIETALFVLKIIKALMKTKKGNAEKVSGKIIDDLKAATPVETGALRDSARFEGNKAGGKVISGGTPETMKTFKGGTFDQALGVEYGTQHTPAQPYYWPTMRNHEKKIEQSLGKAIETEFSD
jgi:HK97 gp10 family phage protein